MSAIHIEKNGRVSSSARSRHINIRFFFIKDILKRENIDVKHCPTERMIADFFTKPLQGKLFRYLRDIVMSLVPLPMEERVGLYVSRPGESIVEECNSDTEISQPPDKRKVSWADIVRRKKIVK